MDDLPEKILVERKNYQKLVNLQEEINNPKQDTTKTIAPYLKVSFNTIVQSESKEEESFDKVPENCIPIKGDVRFINWQKLGETVQFDVIVMDPPWQLASSNPTRGVALGYSQLSDQDIEDMGIKHVQKEGFIFVWVINSKFMTTLEYFKKWGYKYVDELTWVKMTVNRRMAKGHGYYLQHAKETCLVGMKGNPKKSNTRVSDLIYSHRRGQSQKPEEIYDLIEKLVPNGTYLEIFGRKNNLRNHWVTIGNEI